MRGNQKAQAQSELERICADKEIKSGVILRQPRAVPSPSDFARAKVELESSLDFSQPLNIDCLGRYFSFRGTQVLLGKHLLIDGLPSLR